MDFNKRKAYNDFNYYNIPRLKKKRIAIVYFCTRINVGNKTLFNEKLQVVKVFYNTYNNVILPLTNSVQAPQFMFAG